MSVSSPPLTHIFDMKNFKLFVPIVFGLLIVLNIRAGSPTDFNSDSVKITEPTTDLVEITPGKDYDFSYLKPGETAELVYNDNDGNPIRYRITRTTSGIDIAVYRSSLEKADPDTAITFKGPRGVVSSTTVGEINSQRCGWLCIIAHVVCVKVHIGPPGNTWEWDCSSNDD